MGRFIFALIVVTGIGYGGWSLFGPGDDAPDLSSQVSLENGVAPSGDSSVEDPAKKAEPAGAAGTPKDTVPDDNGERLRRLLTTAAGHLEAASKAKTRTAALTEKDKARRLISRAMIESGDNVELREREKLRERIEILNEEVLFSEEPLEGTSFLYTIQPGDRLWTLCYKTFPKEQGLKAEPGFLLWVNGLSDPSRIREGQILKVPREELTLYVRKSSRKLWVLLGGVYVKQFDVGVGKSDKTPEGDFEIETKIEKPAWYYDGKKVPYGNPENPLGTRWMGFKRTRKAAGYGIHGTDEPETIGKALSEGCVRMLNADVEELFTWIPRGTKVTIVR